MSSNPKDCLKKEVNFETRASGLTGTCRKEMNDEFDNRLSRQSELR